MRNALKWLPCAVAALLWVQLGALAQPWVSQTGVLLYTDGALLLFAARHMPRAPAMFLVLFAALCADAARVGAFGLSASLLLPVLLVLLHFQEKLHQWTPLAWLLFIVGLNSGIYVLSAFAWTLRLPAFSFSQPAWPPMSTQTLVLATFSGMLASSIFILLLGHWFCTLQRAVCLLAGCELAETTEEGE